MYVCIYTHVAWYIKHETPTSSPFQQHGPAKEHLPAGSARSSECCSLMCKMRPLSWSYLVNARNSQLTVSPYLIVPPT